MEKSIVTTRIVEEEGRLALRCPYLRRITPEGISVAMVGSAACTNVCKRFLYTDKLEIICTGDDIDGK